MLLKYFRIYFWNDTDYFRKKNCLFLPSFQSQIQSVQQFKPAEIPTDASPYLKTGRKNESLMVTVLFNDYSAILGQPA